MGIHASCKSWKDWLAVSVQLVLVAVLGGAALVLAATLIALLVRL